MNSERKMEKLFFFFANLIWYFPDIAFSAVPNLVSSIKQEESEDRKINMLRRLSFEERQILRTSVMATVDWKTGFDTKSFLENLSATFKIILRKSTKSFPVQILSHKLRRLIRSAQFVIHPSLENKSIGFGKILKFNIFSTLNPSWIIQQLRSDLEHFDWVSETAKNVKIIEGPAHDIEWQWLVTFRQGHEVFFSAGVRYNFNSPHLSTSA